MDLRNLLPWDDAGILSLPSGRIRRRTAEPNGRFWALWRENRNQLTSRGIRVSKAGGSFQVTWDEALVERAAVRMETAAPISADISKLLLPHQPPIVSTLSQALRRYRGALDASGTGTGKTTSSTASHKLAGAKKHVVICPINVISNWLYWNEVFGLDCIAINYEKAIKGIPGILEVSSRGQYRFLEGCYGLTFDEAHRCGGLSTKISRVARVAARQNVPTILLSATLADNPLRMSAAGEILRLFPHEGFWTWAIEHGAMHTNLGWYYAGGFSELESIRMAIFGSGRGVKVNPADIPGFPDIQIQVDLLDVSASASKAITKAHARLSIEASKKDPDRRNIHQLFQEIEMAKLPMAVEWMKDMNEEGNSTILFTRYRESAVRASSDLGCPKIIGGQSQKETSSIIAGFQKDEITSLVLTEDAGNEGINLQDFLGVRPRVTAYMPSGSSRKFRQVVGRTRRHGAKSKSVLRVLLASGTPEVDMGSRLATKITQMDAMTDADFVPYGSQEAAALINIE